MSSILRLDEELVKIIAHVKCLPLTPPPTEAQLVHKTLQLDESLTKIAMALPNKILSIMEQEFALMGWSMQENKVTDSKSFTPHALLAVLESILTKVRAYSPRVVPSTEEIANLSLACTKLWDLDRNRLSPGIDYDLNLQHGKSFFDAVDAAKEPLFTSVDPKVFQRPTFKAFVALLDNYSASVGVTEMVSREEREENTRFLDLIYDYPCMIYVHQILLASGKTHAKNKADFVRELNTLWFELFSKKAKNDSSGFEHVFIGEIKDGMVTGLHSWIQIYLEEKAGRLDYKGFIMPRRRHVYGPEQNEQMVTMNFAWRGAEKKVSTSLVGTSPEFEMALYTLIFYNSPEGEVLTNLGPYKVFIKTHQWEDRHSKKIYIATSYPEAREEESGGGGGGGGKYRKR